MSFENNEETTFRFVDEEEVNGAFEQEEQFIEDQPQGEIQESSFNEDTVFTSDEDLLTELWSSNDLVELVVKSMV